MVKFHPDGTHQMAPPWAPHEISTIPGQQTLELIYDPLGASVVGIIDTIWRRAEAKVFQEDDVDDVDRTV